MLSRGKKKWKKTLSARLCCRFQQVVIASQGRRDFRDDSHSAATCASTVRASVIRQARGALCIPDSLGVDSGETNTQTDRQTNTGRWRGQNFKKVSSKRQKRTKHAWPQPLPNGSTFGASICDLSYVFIVYANAYECLECKLGIRKFGLTKTCLSWRLLWRLWRNASYAGSRSSSTCLTSIRTEKRASAQPPRTGRCPRPRLCTQQLQLFARACEFRSPDAVSLHLFTFHRWLERQQMEECNENVETLKNAK